MIATVASANDALALLEAVAVSATHAVSMGRAGLMLALVGILHQVAASVSGASSGALVAPMLARCCQVLTQLCRVARRMDAIARHGGGAKPSPMPLRAVHTLFSADLCRAVCGCVKLLLEEHSLVVAGVRCCWCGDKMRFPNSRVHCLCLLLQLELLYVVATT